MMNKRAMSKVLFWLCCSLWFNFSSADQLLVNMTLVPNAAALGALCLDGSWPAYHIDRGFGAGARNWILVFEGGGWCNDLKSCLERANTRRGSSRYMNKLAPFNGILSNNASLNPDFYNWNRVKLRYCDGASFAGDSKFDNGKLSRGNEGGQTCALLPSPGGKLVHFYQVQRTSVLYFRGQRIWKAIIHDLLPKGLGQAHKALLSGCSAGGLSVFLHCSNFASILPRNASVKCLSDAGFFMDEIDVSSNRTMRSFYENLITLQGVEKNLNRKCRKFLIEPKLCIFPQYSLRFIRTPFFVLNTAYDVYQLNHILVPPSADLHGTWKTCKLNISNCNETQIDILQGFRRNMLVALRRFFKHSRHGGMFINSCFAHCQSEGEGTWLAHDSPRINNKTIAETVGDWYFSRGISKEIDCPYPCDKTCHNLIPTSPA